MGEAARQLEDFPGPSDPTAPPFDGRGAPAKPPRRRPIRLVKPNMPADGAHRTSPAVFLPTGTAEIDYRDRALTLWPRLDKGRLRRTRGEIARVARLVERRTAMSFEIIVGMLKRGDGSDSD
jgi:hypothetical protein